MPFDFTQLTDQKLGQLLGDPAKMAQIANTAQQHGIMPPNLSQIPPVQLQVPTGMSPADVATASAAASAAKNAKNPEKTPTAKVQKPSLGEALKAAQDAFASTQQQPQAQPAPMAAMPQGRMQPVQQVVYLDPMQGKVQVPQTPFGVLLGGGNGN